jgi:hypothetical protein
VTCIYLFINLQKIDQATPSAALAKEKGVVFVVPRFRLGPMGFLPRLLLNDTSSVIKDSTSFQVRLKNSYFLSLCTFPKGRTVYREPRTKSSEATNDGSWQLHIVKAFLV